jgi:hypothetical protein
VRAHDDEVGVLIARDAEWDAGSEKSVGWRMVFAGSMGSLLSADVRGEGTSEEVRASCSSSVLAVLASMALNRITGLPFSTSKVAQVRLRAKNWRRSQAS